MLPLVSIRTQYLKRHCCAVYCSYLLIPTLITFSLLIAIANQLYSENRYVEDNSYSGTVLESDLNLFNYKDDHLNSRLISFLVDNQGDCEILKEYLNPTELDCNYDEDMLNNKNNLIKIKNKNGKYDIQLVSQDNSYSFVDFETEMFADPFYQPYYYSDSGLYSNDRHFLMLQSVLSKFLIKKEGKEINKGVVFNVGTNSYPPNTGDYTYTIGIITGLGIVICLQFSMTTYFFDIRMIDEKEKKLAILLERQGVSKKKYFFSWMISYLFLAIIPFFTFLFFYLLYVPIHPLLFVLNFLLFICSLFSYAYFLYVCISTTKTGAIVIKFLNFTTAILGWPISYPGTAKLTKVLLGFFPQINFYMCCTCLDKLKKFKSLSWDKIWLKGNKISYMECLILYIAEIAFYTILSLFIGGYKNSGLGFLLYIKSFFTKVSRSVINVPINQENSINHNILPFETHFQELSPFNQQRKEQNDCLKIVNISKEFELLKAVDNFNGELFGNEIFCLLGHNGAGKTTLVNMISGIYDPTKGDIFYKGRSIVTDKNYLFENIGVCQQEDIFFDYLTVSQHLKYMCEIKGGNINMNEINDLIIRIGLGEKATSLCSSLSGGQKRKLCTALALIGNSKIILLDEPTSGMDPIAKKSLWDFLKNYQNDKIILLTTHSLDEAEYLGDRIGIMSDGHFICCGSSSYLKSKYPCGFNINLLINPNKFDDKKKKEIFEKIKNFEPEAAIRVASKSVFSINIQSNNENVDKIFSLIEKSKEEYGIEDYTVASTSLEDVFLKINNKANINDMEYISREQNNQLVDIPNLIETTGFCSQLISQLHRNWIPIKRNVFILILEYLSGLGIIYIFVFLLNGLVGELTSKKLDLKYLLKANNIYIYEPDSMKNYLKNSYAYKLAGSIKFKRLKKQPTDLNDLIDMSYEKAFAHIAKSSISIIKNDNNLYVNMAHGNIGYFYANVMLVVSSFLKNEYGIDATIFMKNELEEQMDVGDDEKMNESTIGILVIVCIGSVFGFVIYLGGLINEKIKERKTNIKHLLYLSGSNPWSYWMAFFIIDYIKLIVFTILLIIPIYYVNSKGGYYFLLNMLVIDLASLIFIYFVSFFGENADSGVKFLFVLLLGFVIFLIGFALFSLFLSIVSVYLLEYVFNSFSKSYNFTIFDLTPITSMLLSFGRLLYSIANYDGRPLSKNGPGTYLLTSYMVQGINFTVYGILLILMENGVLREFFNYLKLKCCISERNFVFSEEEVSNEFLIYNDVTNPLVLNQMDNNISDNPINQPLISNNNLNQNNAIPPIYGNNMNQNNMNLNNINAPIYGNNNMNQNNINAPIYGNNNMNQNNINPPIYGNNNMNQNNMNSPIYSNNNVNQNNLNAPIYGNNPDFMNMPIYGNNLDNLNIPVYDNDNESDGLVINNSLNNNINQPLLGSINSMENSNIINTNSNNSINRISSNNIINNNINSNNNIRVDNIDNAMNELALPETNRTYNVRKGNPYINNEKDILNTRTDLTTRIEGLRKTFWFCCKKSVRAVDNLYLALEPNEKFGLLGFNGSGKTTTFKSITNEILYDYGKITLFGHDNKKEFEKIRNRIGYCPQQNPLFEFMKVKEILEFYSDLKTCNVPYQTICEKFGLTKYLETYCINLSGGNKRKLTFAIAIMNNPTLLLLDEPSTGVDPDSRRLMWKNINELSNSGHKYNMILTTHSMEEAEILCDRVSWLKKGNFVCIGNPERLKIKYSLGYKLHVKFNDEIINQNRNNSQQNNLEGKYRNICNLVTGFTNYSNYILNTPALEPYLDALIDFINKINEYNKKISLIEIGKDLSFKLIVKASPEMKANFFTEILTMKKKHKEISEMIISMESLENILTSF